MVEGKVRNSRIVKNKKKIYKETPCFKSLWAKKHVFPVRLELLMTEEQLLLNALNATIMRLLVVLIAAVAPLSLLVLVADLSDLTKQEID